MLHVSRLKGVSFEAAIIERYRRRESGVEEAMIERVLTGVSVQRMEDITQALWSSKASPATISELNEKAYVHLGDCRSRPLQYRAGSIRMCTWTAFTCTRTGTGSSKTWPYWQRAQSMKMVIGRYWAGRRDEDGKASWVGFFQ